jgi:hypothetical protein
MPSKEESGKIELIVVFKKDIGLKAARAILDKSGIKYREGMDSSRGKLYFYKTGPKFILTFETKAEREKFTSAYENAEEVYELYILDWTKQKD